MLLGVGSIGQEMIRRAAGFGMNVVLWSRRFDGQERPLTEHEARELGLESVLRQIAIELAPTPADVAARADILSVHLALGPETKGLVNAALLAQLKPGAIFINTARGEVVDTRRSPRRSARRGLRVGLDVFANEPAAATGDFTTIARRRCRRLRHAPHRRVDRPGAGSDRRRNRPHHPQLQGNRDACRTSSTWRTRTPATHMLVVRHRDRPGVLAHVFDHLRQANLNVQETENIVFEGAEAAVARINLDGEPPPALCATQIKSGQRRRPRSCRS